MKLFWSHIALLVFAAMPGVCFAAYTDVPTTHPAHAAITALSEQGVLQGYANGSFRPDDLVTRAAAVKILALAFFDQKYIQSMGAYTTYDDVPLDSWYAPYVETLRQNGAIQGPPVHQFDAQRPINKAELLKMLVVLQRMNIHAYAEENKPLSIDIPTADAWYYPYIAHGIAITAIQPNTVGLLEPSAQLTRAETAKIVYSALRYRSGSAFDVAEQRIQEEAALSLQLFEANKPEEAAQASFRSIAIANHYALVTQVARAKSLQLLSWSVGKYIQKNPSQSTVLLQQAIEYDADVRARAATIIQAIEKAPR